MSQLDIKEYERKAKRYVKDREFSKEANEEMRLYNLTMRVNRLEMLKANIGLELLKGTSKLEKFFAEILKGRTMDELKRQAGIMGKTIQNNAELAHSIVNASFHNATFSQRLWMQNNAMKADLDKLLTSGLISGKNPRELAKGIRKYYIGDESLKNGKKGAIYYIERLMRTELARVQTDAQKRSFEKNGFELYRFHVNAGCCHICAEVANTDVGYGKGIYRLDKLMPGVNAAPMHPFCRCAISPYEDSEEYEAWLEYLEKGGATEEWNEFKKRNSESYEPRDRGSIYENKKFASKELIEMSRMVNTLLNEMELPKSKWSGKTFIKSFEEMPMAMGVKKKSCDIWLREDAEIKTIIHEHLHARSSSWFEKKLRKYRSFEEGSCELLAEEICKQYNISYKPTYTKYVEPLREFRKMHGGFSSDYDFSVNLFRIDMDKREEWLNELANQKGKLKSIALKMLISKIRREQ